MLEEVALILANSSCSSCGSPSLYPEYTIEPVMMACVSECVVNIVIDSCHISCSLLLWGMLSQH